MAFHDGVIEGYRKRGILVVAYPRLNLDVVEYSMLDLGTGKVRYTAMSGLEYFRYGLGFLIALLSEAVVSLKMDCETCIRFGASNAE